MLGPPAAALEMQLLPFTSAHVERFLQVAATENWISDRRELEFLLQLFHQGCLVTATNGEIAAYITAIRYAASAWIGNLLVEPDYRRQGFGRALVKEVLQRLDSSGCETVWLTASPDGSHLYRTLGFVQIDKVQRWRATGSMVVDLPRAVDLEHAALLDTMGWGDCRAALFSGLESRAGWLLRKDGFLRCLPTGAGLQLGPWGALAGKGAAALLEITMNGVSGEGGIFLDVPQGNRSAGRLLRSHGFAESGSTLLMYRGRVPLYRPELVYALASMGSYG